MLQGLRRKLGKQPDQARAIVRSRQCRQRALRVDAVLDPSSVLVYDLVCSSSDLLCNLRQWQNARHVPESYQL